MGIIMWYVYNTIEEAQAAADLINANYTEPQPINQGKARHGQHPANTKYCEPMQCMEGWAIIADDFTSQYISGTPQEITPIEPEL